MKPVVVSSLKNSFGQMAAYALIANVHIHIDLEALQAVLGFMNALNVKGNLRSQQKPQCIVPNCRFGNDCWQFITYSIQVRASPRFA